jgi:hypothetical protein
MARYGYFELDGVQQRLYAYKSAPQPGHDHEGALLFVPFRDATSGKKSYGVARNLEIKEDPSGDYVLGFNMAYNPYCAYSDDYMCPFPPNENWLTVPIREGEKTFSLRRRVLLGRHPGRESPQRKSTLNEVYICRLPVSPPRRRLRERSLKKGDGLEGTSRRPDAGSRSDARASRCP